MANTVTMVFVGTDSVIADVTSPSNSLTATIPHPMGAVPDEVTITLLQTLAAINSWAVTSRTTTQVVLTKVEDESGESPAPQIRVYVKRPHSIGR